MKTAAMIVSIAALLALLAAACAYAGGRLTEAANKNVMLLASITWLAAAPFWMTARNK